MLCTLLQRRGVATVEAAEADQGLALLQQVEPDVVVLDLEVSSGEADDVQQAYCRESRGRSTALVMLGITRRETTEGSRHCGLPKPYHYAPLIRTIERLLGR